MLPQQVPEWRRLAAECDTRDVTRAGLLVNLAHIEQQLAHCLQHQPARNIPLVAFAHRFTTLIYRWHPACRDKDIAHINNHGAHHF